MTGNPILSDVSRQFGDTKAVERASPSIKPGQFVGVIYRSGAGKSTLLRLINSPDRPRFGVDFF